MEVRSASFEGRGDAGDEAVHAHFDDPLPGERVPTAGAGEGISYVPLKPRCEPAGGTGSRRRSASSVVNGPVVGLPVQRGDEGVLDGPGCAELHGDELVRRDGGGSQLGQPGRPAGDEQHAGLFEALCDGDEILHERHGAKVGRARRPEQGRRSPFLHGRPRTVTMRVMMVDRCPSAIGVRQAGGWPSGSRVCGPRRRSCSASRAAASRSRSRWRTALAAPLDVLVVRKLGVPFQPELGMGAVGEDGVRVLNADVLRQAGVTETQLAEVEARERAAVEERAVRLRRGRPAIPLAGRTVVIVDDGLATGGTARAAVHVARARGADRVILAVPVAPPETVAALRRDADDVVAVETPEPFFAIGGWYADFSPTSDEEVVELLARSGADRETAESAELTEKS